MKKDAVLILQLKLRKAKQIIAQLWSFYPIRKREPVRKKIGGALEQRYYKFNGKIFQPDFCTSQRPLNKVFP